jgi:hypothetical protein
VPESRTFPEEIVRISGEFIEIYGQAAAAEAVGLSLICGPGYRKALEFLIKDFTKSLAAADADREIIEHLQLGPCISRFVDDGRLKAMALRAAWLGNDETHYVRKWATKDLSDLKKLIDLTVHWVSSAILTRELEASMPDPKAAKP